MKSRRRNVKENEYISDSSNSDDDPMFFYDDSSTESQRMLLVFYFVNVVEGDRVNPGDNTLCRENFALLILFSYQSE